MMPKKSTFDDPLTSIDPIMEEAFTNQSTEKVKKTTKAKKTSKKKKKKTTSAAKKTAANDITISDVQFPELSKKESGQPLGLDIYSNIPVNLSVELGRSEISLKEVYELTEGSIIELDRLVGEPLDLVVNGQIIAQGEVVAIDNNYGFRITNIVSAT
tara:strand:+ start:942 stop:1412 length:471 start_codon:yes stop_codon:yes gene_type:complete